MYTLPMLKYLILLAGCTSPTRVHTIAPVGTPPVETAPVEAAPELPPPGHHSGYQPGPALLKSPQEVWFLMLDGPVVAPIQTEAGRFFAVANGTVYGVSKDGKLLWKQKNGATDVRIGASGLWVTAPDRLLLLQPSDGTVLRTVDAPGIRGPAEETGGGQGAGGQGAGGQGAGEVAWISRQATLTTGAGAVPINQTPVGHLAAGADGTIFVTTLEGELLAIQGTDIRWRTLLPGSACSGATLDAGRVYVPIAAAGKEQGGIVAYDRATGAEVWRFRTGYQPGGSLSVGESVWIADKDGTIYALNPSDGAEIWRAEGSGEYRTQAIWSGRSLYAGNGDGRIYRIDLDDGGAAWSMSLGAPVTGDPVMEGGLLVVGTAAGRLVGLAEVY